MATATKNMQSENSNKSQGSVSQQAKSASHDVMEYLRDYARDKPEAAALWCLGIGFVLGWKLKPW